MSSLAPYRASRRRREPLISVTASSRPVDLKSRIQNRLQRPVSKWQPEAWGYYDTIPEVKYAVRHFGDAMAKVRLRIAIETPETEDPVPVYDENGNITDTAAQAGITTELAASAVAELARLRRSPGGMPGLLAKLNQNYEVPGECWMIGYGERTPTPDNPEQEPEPERWEIRSVDEVATDGYDTFVKDAPDQTKTSRRKLDPDLDTLIRLWIPHPRFHGLPDSPMLAALQDCRALIGLSNEIIAETNSQAGAGLLLIPNEVNDPSTDPTRDDDDDDPFMTDLEDALIAPIEDPDSPKAVAPIALRGPASALKEVRHISFARTGGDRLDARIEARVLRLARAMNVPVEVIEGHMATTFANAEQIDQNEWDDHYEPRARLIGSTLTSAFLHPNLADAGYDRAIVENLVVWCDGSSLVREPDVEENATAAHDSNAISDAALRKALGFTEEDAPGEDELLRRIGSKQSLTTDVTLKLLQLFLANELGEDLTPEISAEADPGTDPEDPEDGAAVVAALMPARARDYGSMLTAIDRELRSQLTSISDLYMGRALQSVGSRLRTKARVREYVAKHIPNNEVASLVPSTVLAAVTNNDPASLLDGAFDQLEQEYRSGCVAAFDAALDVVHDATDGVDDEERTRRHVEFETGVDAGWQYALTQLTRVATQRMSEPVAVVAADGETDSTMFVPTGLIRAALAIAGSAATETADIDEDGLFLALRPSGGAAGMIATGARIGAALRDNGAGIEGYRWVYGPGLRRTQFEPHRRLDGVEFVNFDDDVLRNPDSWPRFSHYIPGDHRGCKCDFEPIIITP